VGDAVLPADLVEEHFGGFEGEAVGEDLPVVGEDFLGHPVAFESLDEEAADRAAVRPDHDPRAHTESRVVVDPGQDLGLGAVVEEDASDHVQLPELHRSAPFPSLVGDQTLPVLLRLDRPVAHQTAIDRHVARQVPMAPSSQLVEES
jgi:hypothetical protein